MDEQLKENLYNILSKMDNKYKNNNIIENFIRIILNNSDNVLK